MNLLLRFVTIGILSVLVFGFGSTYDVWACSGGRNAYINELVSYADIIVRGYILERDDTGQNAIMRVTEYLKGDGDEFILLSIHSPTSVLASRVRPDSGGCYSGLYSSLVQNREIIIFLNKHFYGSYRAGDSGGSYHIKEDYQQANIRIWGDFLGIHQDRTVTYDNFISIIQRIVGTDPTLPVMNTPYPLRAPLLITTELGTKYILPVDGSPPILPSELGFYEPHLESFLKWLGNLPTSCWNVGCLGRSKNLLDTGEITAEGVIIEYITSPFSRGYANDNKAFAFSPTNHGVVAVWKNSGTTIRSNQIEYDTTIQIRQYEHPFMGFPLILEIPIKTDVVYPNSGAWSPDGRFLAFADIDGIYLWDVFTEDSVPELIFETTIKTIQGFSPLGQFLIIGDNENGLSLDLITRNTYPAGVFSPNEQRLALYGDEIASFQFIPRNPYHVQNHITRNELEEGYSVEKIVWHNNDIVYRLICKIIDEKKSCTLDRERFMGFGGFPPYVAVVDFDYDDKNQQLVVLHEDSIISIRTPSRLGEYDLSPYLDSPIASIEWLPSLFYYDS